MKNYKKMLSFVLILIFGLLNNLLIYASEINDVD